MNWTVFTATRNRPEALDLCARWVRHQTVEAHWHVVSGRPWREAFITGLPEVEKCDQVAVFDDDDYYPPHYLACFDRALRQAPKGTWVGAKWYNAIHIRKLRLGCLNPRGPLPCTITFPWKAIPEIVERMRDGKDLKALFRGPVLSEQAMTPIKGLYPDGGISVKHNFTVDRFPITLTTESADKKLGGHLKDYLDAIAEIDRRLG